MEHHALLTSPAVNQPTAAHDKPEVSWLLCTHVADEQLRQALTSCFDQSLLNFECVLVANGEAAAPVANTVLDWFGHDPRLRVFTTEVKHLTFSLSLGLHHARAPLVARMDGDDIATPERLADQVKFMNLHPNVVVLGSNYERIDAQGNSIDQVHLPTDNASIRKALLWGNPLCHPSVIFRRDTALAAGGYLGGIYAQDYDLWSRIAINRSVAFANLPKIYLRYRMVGVGAARRSRLAYASMAASQFRNFTVGAGWKWGIAAAISAAKAFLRSV
jgi:glycosyltransferase involved in cell wall biosynthesis